MQLCKKIVSFFAVIAVLFNMSFIAFADGEEVIPAANEQQITARSAILMEASTGQVLFEQQSQNMIPIGTLNKIMTILLIAEELDSGELSLTDQITASTKANSVTGAVIWLNVGEKMTAEDLIKGVIIGNANDASVALAEAISGTEEEFVKKMNSRAKELGMSNTCFKNCTGYDEKEQYSTAYDVALMTRELVKHESMYPYMTCWMDTVRNGETSVVNANTLVKSYNGIIGVKAGYTEAALNCISAAAKRDGIIYIAVVLGCEDKDARFSEAKALMNSGFANYQVESPAVPSEVLTPIKVTGGTANEVGIKVESLVNIVIPNGTADEITNKINLPEELSAPIKKDQIIGEIEFYRDDILIYRSNLLAIEDVNEMTFFKAFGVLLKKMLEF